MVIGRIEIVEEDSSDAPRLFPVRNVKVFVAPFLEGTIENAGSVFVAGVFEGLVEMDRVFRVEIRWGQVAPPSKPPRDDFRWVFWIGNFEIAVVRVDGRCVGVAGVNDQADTGGEEGEGSLRVRI